MRDQYSPDSLFNADDLLEWLRLHGDNSVEDIFNVRLGNFMFVSVGEKSSCYETDHMEFKCYANVKYKKGLGIGKLLSKSSLGLDPM